VPQELEGVGQHEDRGEHRDRALIDPRFLKTKVVLSVSAQSTNPIAKYDEGTHKTAGATFLVVFSMAQGHTMNQGWE